MIAGLGLGNISYGQSGKKEKSRKERGK